MKTALTEIIIPALGVAVAIGAFVMVGFNL